MIDITKLRQDYHYNKICTIEDLVPAELCINLVVRAKELILKGQAISLNSAGLGNKKVLDGGGVYRHKLLDGETCKKHFPELTAIYHCIVPFLSLITDQDIIVSPYLKSNINVKIYDKGDEQGWHYDTNTITALLYLTDNTEGATSCQVRHEHPSLTEPKIISRKILPKAGTLLLMQGRDIWHCAEVMKNEIKVSVPLNYYTPLDTWRPLGIDDLVYGNLQDESKKITY